MGDDRLPYLGSRRTHSRSPASRLIVILVLLFGADAGTQSVPSDWTTTDIGAPAIPGYATFSGGTYSISGSGSDIGGTADQFTFVHRMLTGDGAIVARIESLDNTDPWA